MLLQAKHRRDQGKPERHEHHADGERHSILEPDRSDHHQGDAQSDILAADNAAGMHRRDDEQ